MTHLICASDSMVSHISGGSSSSLNVPTSFEDVAENRSSCSDIRQQRHDIRLHGDSKSSRRTTNDRIEMKDALIVGQNTLSRPSSLPSKDDRSKHAK